MDDHPNEVFLYSVKHNYLDLADKAARLTLKNSASNFLLIIKDAGLRDDIAFRWVGLPFPGHKCLGPLLTNLVAPLLPSLDGNLSQVTKIQTKLP